VEICRATEDIFGKVKSKGMECAVDGKFIEFDTVEELNGKLTQAAESALSVRLFDVNIGG
jgi:hypothetical protein